MRQRTVTPQPKSVGNSTTTPRDLVCDEDVKRTLFVLADSVARRLREKSLCGNTVTIWLRRKDLSSFTHRCTLGAPTDVAFEIADAAMALFHECYSLNSDKPLRSVGITVSDIKHNTPNPQISLLRMTPSASADAHLSLQWTACALITATFLSVAQACLLMKS